MRRTLRRRSRQRSQEHHRAAVEVKVQVVVDLRSTGTLLYRSAPVITMYRSICDHPANCLCAIITFYRVTCVSNIIFLHYIGSDTISCDSIYHKLPCTQIL